MDTLFSNVTVVTMDEELRVLFSAFVGVTEGKISYLSKKAPEEQPKEIINGEGMVLMPGLINCHTHLPMSPLRGYADDVDLQTWLNEYIFPVEDKLDSRAVKAGTALALAEAISCGITSVSDMYYFCDDIIGEVVKSGISANIARGVTVFTEDYDPATDTVTWCDSNMKGEKRNGERYAWVQFDASKEIDWFVDAFCRKKYGATIYRLRDDIIYAE